MWSKWRGPSTGTQGSTHALGRCSVFVLHYDDPYDDHGHVTFPQIYVLAYSPELAEPGCVVIFSIHTPLYRELVSSPLECKGYEGSTSSVDGSQAVSAGYKVKGRGRCTANDKINVMSWE